MTTEPYRFTYAALQRCEQSKVVMALLTALLTAYRNGGQQKDDDGALPLDLAQANPRLPASCVPLLQGAADGRWEPAVSLHGEQFPRTTLALAPALPGTPAAPSLPLLLLVSCLFDAFDVL